MCYFFIVVNILYEKLLLECSPGTAGRFKHVPWSKTPRISQTWDMFPVPLWHFRCSTGSSSPFIIILTAHNRVTIETWMFLWTFSVYYIKKNNNKRTEPCLLSPQHLWLKEMRRVFPKNLGSPYSSQHTRYCITSSIFWITLGLNFANTNRYSRYVYHILQP